MSAATVNPPEVDVAGALRSVLIHLVPEVGREALDSGVSPQYVQSLYPMWRVAVDSRLFEMLLPVELLFPGGSYDRVYAERLLGRVQRESTKAVGRFGSFAILFSACGHNSSSTVRRLTERLGPGAEQAITRGRVKNMGPKNEVGLLLDMVSIAACAVTEGLPGALTPEAQQQAWLACAGVGNLLRWVKGQM